MKEETIMLDYTIKERIKENKKTYKSILKAIKKYDKIVVFRHQMPDFDAIGTQMGLANWIKDNFPNKTVYTVGEDHVNLTPRLFPYMDKVDDAFFSNEKFLAIVVDTGNSARISDDRYQKADFIIKIDHHPNVEPYGNIVLVNDDLAAASELVCNMLLSYKMILTEEAAKYFYIGIVGDSGRFMYKSTTPHTMAISKILIETGFDLSKDIYQRMYMKNIDDLRVTAYILTHFQVSPNGVAYYILPRDIQKELKITVERGKENINQFANIEGINAWCSITEDEKKGNWRVSIRSKEKSIKEVAAKFNGGGHDQASGATLDKLDDLDKLIKELDNLFA